MLRRKLAANPNEHGEGALAEEIADRALALAQEIEGDYENADAVFKALNAQLAIVHEVSGKPQERIEHSGSTARTLIVFPGEDSDAPAPALPEGEG